MAASSGKDKDRLTAAEAAEQCLQLRLTGATYDDIAKVMGCNKSTAKRRIDRAIAAVTQETARAVVLLENQRLDRAQRAIWPAVITGQLGAIDRLIKIQERRARLNGYDAPQKVDLGVPDVDLAQAAAEIQKAAEQRANRRE